MSVITNMIFFLFKLRVVIPDVSILPEDLEELYDLFKVGLPEKQGMHLFEASLSITSSCHFAVQH